MVNKGLMQKVGYIILPLFAFILTATAQATYLSGPAGICRGDDSLYCSNKSSNICLSVSEEEIMDDEIENEELVPGHCRSGSFVNCPAGKDYYCLTENTEQCLSSAQVQVYGKNAVKGRCVNKETGCPKGEAKYCVDEVTTCISTKTAKRKKYTEGVCLEE